MRLPRFEPMLPVSQCVGDAGAFAQEIKWDGFRALAYLEGAVRLESRNGKSFNRRFPTIVAELKYLGQGIILDGEIIALTAEGRPEFSLLRKLPNSTTRLFYIVFDLLFSEGRSICSEPWSKRRRHLELLLKSNRGGGSVIISPLLSDVVEDCLAFAKQHQLEGIVSKQKDSPYLPGVRSSFWRKHRLKKSIDCVVVALNFSGNRLRSLGVAVYNRNQAWQYIGNVGSGLGQVELDFLRQAMPLLQTEVVPVVNPPSVDFEVVWLKPHLVVELEYLEFTPQGRLRHPVFIRFRIDKDAQACLLGVDDCDK